MEPLSNRDERHLLEGLPSVCGHRKRTKTFSAPRSDIRITLPGLSERAAADKRKCDTGGEFGPRRCRPAMAGTCERQDDLRCQRTQLIHG